MRVFLLSKLEPWGDMFNESMHKVGRGHRTTPALAAVNIIHVLFDFAKGAKLGGIRVILACSSGRSRRHVRG